MEERHTEGHADRLLCQDRLKRQVDRKTGRQADKQTYGQTDRHIGRRTD